MLEPDSCATGGTGLESGLPASLVTENSSHQGRRINMLWKLENLEHAQLISKQFRDTDLKPISLITDYDLSTRYKSCHPLGSWRTLGSNTQEDTTITTNHIIHLRYSKD